MTARTIEELLHDLDERGTVDMRDEEADRFEVARAAALDHAGNGRCPHCGPDGCMVRDWATEYIRKRIAARHGVDIPATKPSSGPPLT